VGALENTIGIWDGGVPIVQAVPVSVPNNLSIRALAALVLQSKSDQIKATLRPSGTQNPFTMLSPTDSAVLMEAVKFGVPLQSWENYTEASDVRTLMLLTEGVRTHDPSYAVDFWTKPGYLGTEESELGDVFRAELVDEIVSLERIEYGPGGVPARLVLKRPVMKHKNGLEFTLCTDQGDTQLRRIVGTFDPKSKTLLLDINGNDATLFYTISLDMKL
jgi:hypothetical protein